MRVTGKAMNDFLRKVLWERNIYLLKLGRIKQEVLKVIEDFSLKAYDRWESVFN